ncbi:hypothetical protein [Pseudomonas sp. Leaf127]|uniref:hypothetical protein n=1 Tax=Pseudomonas sp. Leaf127 TaxID=1736267 RepID=UPI000B1F21C4|nr:hypothetical protein [Pseudomonas sp. Leaf127]
MPTSFKLSFFLLLLSSSGLAQAKDTGVRISVTNDTEETVFDWSQDKCSDENIPDSPARAFKSADGQVYLYATHYVNVPLVGASLKKVKPVCSNIFTASMDPDPERYNARIWLQSFYTENNGKTVYSLGSSDYHASWFNKCPDENARNKGCWWSSIVLARSDDGGRSFITAQPPKHIVARSPNYFSTDSKEPSGFFTTSNIFKKDQYYYSFFYSGKNKDQPKGNCLARTSDLNDASSWRAWDGKDFNQQFATSPNKSLDSSQSQCKVIESLPYKIRSLVWHEASKKYIAVFEDVKKDKSIDHGMEVSFNYSWSENLFDWSKPITIISVKKSDTCRKPQVSAAYPSIIDEDSTDPNFGTVGNSAYLYYTRFNLSDGCRLTLDRDLVRVPVSIN